jgi:hypothetical protein
MRYYVIDVKGTVHADTDSREKTESTLKFQVLHRQILSIL